MYYYSFNIGDYAKETRHLSNNEDLAYRRLLDLYYMDEKPLQKDIDILSRAIGMRDSKEDIQYILQTFFTLEDDGYHNKRADKEINNYHSKAETARANGKKGGRPKKTKSKPDSNPEETSLVNLANPEETGSQANRKPITVNRKPNIKDLFDSSRIIPVWNSLGCKQHRGLTQSAEKALAKTYKEYCKSADNPKELNDWLESYLIKGFGGWMTNHHRDIGDGQWSADLEFAVRFSTYDKIKNTVIE